MRRVKLTPEIREFIDGQIKGSKALNYTRLKKVIAQRYGVHISKATISKRAKALKIEFRRGRKRLAPVGKKPARSIFLDCAGAFFLKGAELEMGFLSTMNRLLSTSTESAKARKALKLAQQINALLLYAPIFELKTAEDLAGYHRRGLLYLTEQNELPSQNEIDQYLQFLSEQKLLLPIIKEAARVCAQALSVRINFAGQTFYLDAQGRTVWPSATKIPRCFNTTLNKANGYIKDIFQSPSPQRPLILQASPGYTFLPTEMFNLIQCLEQAHDEPVSRIVVIGKDSENLAFWENLKAPRRCFFLAPLSPWQYARLQGTKIVCDFRQYHIGPEKEVMAVADARINLFNPQLNRNISLRAALVRRKEERLALITNISRREERYIRKIAEWYFTRWPDKKAKTYFDLLEEAHQEMLMRGRSQAPLAPFIMTGYSQRPQDAFRLFLEHLHCYAQSRFFSSEYDKETLVSMREKFYRQGGYLKIKQESWEIFLRPFSPKKMQDTAVLACQKFNQSDLKFPEKRRLRIYLQ